MDLKDWIETLKTFDYLIFDEAHYFFQDVSFNKNTVILMNLISDFKGIVVMLSATPQLLTSYYERDIIQEYYIEPDYSYIDQVFLFEDKDYKTIIEQIPSDEKILYFGQNKQRLKKYKKDFPNSDFISSDNRASNKTVKEIIESNQFSCRILFSTCVLDNGINIIDPALKHIFIDVDDVITAIQCLGRKRVLKETNEKITLYIKERSKQHYIFKWRELKEQMAIYKDYAPLSHEGLFGEKYATKKLPYFIDNNLKLIKPAVFFFKQKYKFVKAIMSGQTTFSNELLKILGKQTIQKYQRESLAAFLQANLNRRFYKKDQAQIIQTIDLRQDGKLKKSYSLLNDFLKSENLPFEIVSKRDNYRNSSNYKKIYWEICPKNWRDII